MHIPNKKQNKELRKKKKKKKKDKIKKKKNKKFIDKIAGSNWKIIEKHLQLISATAI